MPEKEMEENEGSEVVAEKPSAAAIQSPKGMRDILPADQPIWDRIKKSVREVADFYNFQRIDTPIVERAEVFETSVGETSEIVEKQMFELKAGKDRLVLRPENTASIVRSYIQHAMHLWPQPVRLYYEGPMFRHESPQAGRFRQFFQAGFEILSSENDPVYDAQVMLVVFRLIESLKIKDSTIHLNTVGCKQCRPGFVRKLKVYYKDRQKNLCADCKRRYTDNPLRLLDCKNATCIEMKSGAPSILDSICAVCKKHFKSVLEMVEALKLPYMLNMTLVRGLDYYTKTVFEVFTDGFDSAIASGGRYDYLVELLGGRDTPAVGAAAGLDRIAEVVKARGISFGIRSKPKVALIHIGGTAKHKSLALIEEFRKEGVDIVEYLGKESLKAQLKSADKAESSLALLLGQKEAYEGTIIIRDMKTGVQETVPLEKAVQTIKKRTAS